MIFGKLGGFCELDTDIDRKRDARDNIGHPLGFIRYNMCHIK